MEQENVMQIIQNDKSQEMIYAVVDTLSMSSPLIRGGASRRFFDLFLMFLKWLPLTLVR